MVHYDESQDRGANTLSRLVRRIFGIACLIAVPGLWIAAHGALPEVRMMGLGLSVVVMGMAGLCFIGPERR